MDQKDEGYISPLGVATEIRSDAEGFGGPIGIIERRPPRTSLLSWDSLQKWKTGESLNRSSAFCLTEAVGTNSANILDNLWKITPEMRSIALGNQVNASAFGDSEISRLVHANTVPKYLSMERFLRDCFDMLTGKRSKTFSYDAFKKFTKNPSSNLHGISPTTLASFCTSLRDTANIVLQLRDVENMFHFHLSNSEAHFNVGVKFINFIKDYLVIYETIIMVKRNSIKSLLALKQFIRPFQKQIEVLWTIAESQKFLSPSLLLRNLNDAMLKCEHPCVSDLLKNLLCVCASAYLRYVGDWVFRGQLTSTLEFFISKTNAKPSRDRKLWTHQYALNDDVPHFLVDLKAAIFAAGKTFILLKNFDPDSEIPCVFDEDNDFQIEVLSSYDDILDLTRKYEKKLHDFFTTNAYLRDEVQLAVTQLLESKLVCSSEEIEEAETRFAERRNQHLQELEEAKRKVYDKKQVYLLELLSQIQEVREQRVRAAIDEAFEHKKRIEYQEEADRKARQRGMKLLEEYYGELFHDVIAKVNQEIKTGVFEETFAQIPASEDSYTVEDMGFGSGDGSHNLDACYETVALEKEDGDSVRKLTGITATDTDDKTSEVRNQKTSHVLFTQEPGPEKLFKIDLTMFDKPLIPKQIEREEQQSELESLAINEQDEFLTNRLFTLSVEIPVLCQQRLLNAYAVHHLVVKNNLFGHLKVLQDCLLMQNGLFLHFLVASFISKVEVGSLKVGNDLTTNSWLLNSDLESNLTNFAPGHKAELLTQVLVDFRKEGAEKSDKKTNPAFVSGFEVLNDVSLCYNVNWPLNLVLSEEMMRKYQEVCSLQLRIKRTELLLKKAYVNVKSKVSASSQYSQLNSYRSVMLHFVRAVQSYINVNVIHSEWPETVVKLSKCESIERLHDVLVHHIKHIISSCLLSPKAKTVMKLLFDQLNIIESFSVKFVAWSSNTDLITNEKLLKHEFKMLVRLYMVFMEIQQVFADVIFTVSNRGYYPKVAHFMEAFNFNRFYTPKPSKKTGTV